MSFLDKLLGRFKGGSGDSHEVGPSTDTHASEPMPASTATAGSAMGEPPRPAGTGFPADETTPEPGSGEERTGGPI